MTKKYRGKDFLFSDDCGFINDEDGESYRYSDGSGYYHGNDGSEGYRYADDSGYFKGPSGYQTFYDAEDEQDCDTEDEEHSSALISFAEGFGAKKRGREGNRAKRKRSKKKSVEKTTSKGSNNSCFNNYSYIDKYNRVL